MKKYLVILAIAAIGFAACNKTQEAKTFSANIVLSSSEAGIPMPSEFSVKVTSQDGTVVFDQTVAAAGSSVTVSGLIAGNYSISVFGASDFGGRIYNFSGSAVACAITQEGQNVEIVLNVSKETALLFKEIYYTGPSGYKEEGASTPYRDDNFFEIFNNSSTDVYLDGLCIAHVAPTTATETYSWELDGGRDAKDYVYCPVIWQFPGSGNQYKIPAGKSVVVASVPIDHTKKIDGSLDLSSADFEFFVENQNIYTDNVNIPNMVLKFGQLGNGADRYLPTVMGPAMILFNPEGSIDNSTFVSPVGKDDKCKEIPVSWVVDGVEAINTADKIEFKRLPASIDGGAVYMTEGIEYEPIPGYPLTMTRYDHTSVSFSRKFKNGSDISEGFMDTNNSSNDFVANPAPAIRRGL